MNTQRKPIKALTKFESKKHAEFEARFWEYIAESFAVGRYNSFDDINIQAACNAVHNSHITNYQGRRDLKLNLGIRALESLPAFCTEIIERIKSEQSIEEMREQFFFEGLSDFFDLHYEEGWDEYNKEWCKLKDEQGLPAIKPTEIRDYLVGLQPTYNEVVGTKPEQDYETILLSQDPTRNFYRSESGKRNTLTRVIKGKMSKGLSLSGLFFYLVPEDEKKSASKLICKQFLRLCRFRTVDDFILVNDDKDSLDFRLAVLDTIPFFYSDNKLLFRNKIEQVRHNAVAQAIEDAFIKEYEKQFG